MADTQHTPCSFHDTNEPLGAVNLRIAIDGMTLAELTGGCNECGANAPGIGIGVGEGSIEGTPSWTLLDQTEPNGVARTPQVGQYIGGAGFTLRDGTDWINSGGVSGKGITGINVYDRPDRPTDNTEGVTAPNNVDGQAQLVTLAAGWVSDGTP